MTQEQEQLYRLLEFFSAFCQKHKLKYWLVGGTLLGAVRHQGFIPWDDDVDIAMPIEDYRRFASLQESLPNELTLLTESNRPDYPFFFCELCDTRTKFLSGNRNGPDGIYLDIFPILPSRAPDRTAEFFFNIISVIGYVLQVKTGWSTYIPYKKFYARLSFHLLKLLSVEQLRRLRNKIADKLSSEATAYCFSPGGGHKGLTEFYPKKWFAYEVQMLFERGSFPVPVGWDRYLTQLYGEYMVLPPESEQKTLHKK